MQTEHDNGDLLGTLETPLVRADGGKRFVNYLIDVVCFYILAFAVGILFAVLSPETIEGIGESESFNPMEQILALVFYALYMALCEIIFKGKSLGKLITGTRAVKLDGSTIDASNAFGRGFSRAVPFCVFSALGTPCIPWQDRWTNTMVIDERQSGTR